MSVFVQQQGTICDFSGGDSWVILSPIEQSIKHKIEAVGTPLKDWDINIYRGVLTGYNDAFIIPTEKRDEILANCQSEDERKRTEELIRPILRGRDIKRYGYEWANMWLIATFPARHYDIEKYPAVKKYLESFAHEYLIENGYAWVASNYLSEYCRKKLEQSGKDIIINGKPILDAKGTKEKSRKKTSNKWFETQDSISYWDLFYQPKICWKAVGRNLTFAIAESGIFLTAPASFISAKDSNAFILGYLCSCVGKYFIYKNSDTTGAGDIMLNIQSLIKFPIPRIMGTLCQQILDLVEELTRQYNQSTQDELDAIVLASYGFDQDEITEILNA